jgi:hypothetical protein
MGGERVVLINDGHDTGKRQITQIKPNHSSLNAVARDQSVDVEEAKLYINTSD